MTNLGSGRYPCPGVESLKSARLLRNNPTLRSSSPLSIPSSVFFFRYFRSRQGKRSMEKLFKRAITSVYEVKRCRWGRYALSGRNGERQEVSWRGRACSCGCVRLGWCMHLVYVALFHRKRENWNLDTLTEARDEAKRPKRKKKGERKISTGFSLSSSLPTTCSICQLPVEHIAETKTECNHVFHTACIDRWVSQSLSDGRNACCPNCRTVMVPERNREEEAQEDEENTSLLVHRRRFRARRRLFIFAR